MQGNSQVSYIWQDAGCASSYNTGVSLHSHTSLSLETLSFIHGICTEVPMIKQLVDFYDKRCQERSGFALNFEAAHWRPPLVPKMAFDCEAGQIQALGLQALVSITDHDDIQAPLLLRTIPSARHIPVSLEWSVPYGRTSFHMGIHNLPSALALQWMERFKHFTAAPDETALPGIFAELNALPQVLIILNHPEWDLFKIGEKGHTEELQRFLLNFNDSIHALELNGLRHSRENRKVMKLARTWNQVVISGGDRHGIEPNANINLTNALTFSDFVQEVRVERKSHVLFMQQYARPWGLRLLDSTLDAICDHPHFSPGWQRWDERAFHPDKEGRLRTLADFWAERPCRKAPIALRVVIQAARIFRTPTAGVVMGLLVRAPRKADVVMEQDAVGETA